LEIKIAWLGDARIYAARGVNEFLNRNVPITPLAIKVARFGRRIFHAEHKRVIDEFLCGKKIWRL
jgi:hypothetical protein